MNPPATYMRAVDHKGVGPDGDNSWLVKDMHQELKARGYPGGGQNELIMKSDGEAAIVAVREALARCHGGRITPEMPPKGEHQSNGRVEEAGRTIRDHARVLKIHLPPVLLGHIPAEIFASCKVIYVSTMPLEHLH